MRLFAYISALLLCACSLNADHASTQPAAAVSEVTIKVSDHPKLGKILTDSKGMTLYIFTPDKAANSSTCYDQCTVAWPPYVVTGKPSLPQGVSGDLNTTNRRDNKAQVTYNGMPLYYYSNDKKPGDVNGQNVDNKWFVVNPNK